MRQTGRINVYLIVISDNYLDMRQNRKATGKNQQKIFNPVYGVIKSKNHYQKRQRKSWNDTIGNFVEIIFLPVQKHGNSK